MDLDVKELRALAVAAIEAIEAQDYYTKAMPYEAEERKKAVMKAFFIFRTTVNDPLGMLALLDRLEASERVINLMITAKGMRIKNEYDFAGLDAHNQAHTEARDALAAWQAIAKSEDNIR